ncbi:YneF family protein [[Mycoplasma] gypis]|uniref:YneF family protein n=1 Tax=[Mycoplasma] gypis TaxID=92404 RepID=A0ABZ2RQ62_9BACT|nr:YneF family protein [[Mycoplasma] gypis]MBN0919351.1 YneF family protein [[Mycoplasma] gypis]
MSTGWVVAIALICATLGILIGGFVGVYFTQKKIKRQLDENPPINEKMIRAMFLQMGRKPSEAQIKQVMRSMKQAK